MDNYLILLLITLLTIFIILLSVITWISYKFLKVKEREFDNLSGSKPIIEHEEKPESSKRLKSLLRSSPKSSDYEPNQPDKFCVDHLDQPAYKLCSISGLSYCQKCMVHHQQLWMARKYLSYYTESSWTKIAMIALNGNSDLLERIRKIKSHLWQEQGISLIMQGHYKINIENDQIESYLVLLAREQDAQLLKSELSFIS